MSEAKSLLQQEYTQMKRLASMNKCIEELRKIIYQQNKLLAHLLECLHSDTPSKDFKVY